MTVQTRPVLRPTPPPEEAAADSEPVIPTGIRAGRRLRLLIWVFALFIVFTAWAVPLQRVHQERREALAAATLQNENRAIMLEQYVERTLEAAEIATFHVAERYRNGEAGLRDGTNARPATIRGAIAGRRSFLGVSIADANGDLVASTRGSRVAGQNVRGSRGFDVHIPRDSGEIYVGRPVASRTFGRDVIWLTRRINNADGSFGGVVAINIPPAQLIGFHELVTIQPTDIISLIGLDGITRARRTGDVVSAGEDVSGGLVMRMQRRHPNGTYIGPGSLDGVVRIFSHRQLPGYPLFATYGVLRESVLAPVERRARLIVVGASLVTLITLAFAFFLDLLLRRRDRWAGEVAESNRRLEEAQRIGRIGDWELDVASGEIRWSPQLFEMYERDPEEGVPSRAEFDAILDEESRLVLTEAVERAIATSEPQSYELIAHLPSGREAHRLVAAIPIRDGTGRVVRVHGTDQDVSARKKLDRLEAEVSHLSRLEAMNAMAATLAHELNQPLAAASNFLVGSRKMLSSATPKTELADEGLRAAQQQVQFAGEIIRRVRSMVANDPKQLSSVSVARVID
ncbi:MAG: PAS domain-containing protein, partial [Allosphingosinicella sp.]